MAEHPLPFDAEVVHDLPADLNREIGRVMVAFARLEHQLSSLVGLLLQLNKPEARVALKAPRAKDRLEMALDIFAIKGINIKLDTAALAKALDDATSERDRLAHGIWLRHPKTHELYLRMTRGAWPKDMTRGERVSRAVYPQSIRYSTKDARAALALIEKALSDVAALGAELDDALRTYPERFREPAPVLNPLGRRSRKRRGDDPADA